MLLVDIPVQFSQSSRFKREEILLSLLKLNWLNEEAAQPQTFATPVNIPSRPGMVNAQLLLQSLARRYELGKVQVQ